VREEDLKILFNNIIDNLELDDDIVAIAKILEVLLHVNKKESFKNFKKVLNKYDIRRLKYDIDFTSLLVLYPIKIEEILGVKSFLDFVSSLNLKQKRLFYEYFFNTYKESGIVLLFKDVIKNNEKENEELLIKFITENDQDFPALIYSRVQLFKWIIKFHLDYNLIDISFLISLCEMTNPKDAAVLKTLLLDIL